MAFVDTIIVVVVIVAIVLGIWAMITGQRIIEILYEIKEFIQSFKEEVEE